MIGLPLRLKKKLGVAVVPVSVPGRRVRGMQRLNPSPNFNPNPNPNPNPTPNPNQARTLRASALAARLVDAFNLSNDELYRYVRVRVRVRVR